ncbi:DUF3488 domain-containing protein [Candidatus Sumerlaeota bacterium]|nr:DUF3488 domain-containing protein [Candidatus Sumerlaeota bacterium]
MSLDRTYRLFTYLSAFCAFVMLALFADLHAVAVILFLSFFFLGIFRGRFRIPISNVFWLVVSILVLLMALYGWFIVGERLYSVVYLFLYLEINKIWTEEKPRDTLQIYGLSFFQILAASVSTSSVFFAPALAIYLFLILGALITFTMKRDAEASLDPKGFRHRKPGDPGEAPTPEEVQALGRLDELVNGKFMSVRFSRWLMVALAFIIIVGTGIFFLIPRMPAQSFLSSYTPKSPSLMTSGFSDSVEFSGMGEIQTNPAIVMRVIPKRGFPMSDGEPTLDVLRLRGTALDYYDGRRWSKGSDVVNGIALPDRRRTVAFRVDPAHNNPRSAYDMEIQLEPNKKGFLFGPDRTTGYTFERDALFVQVDYASESVQATINNWVTTLKYTTQSFLPVENWEDLRDTQATNPSQIISSAFRRAWGMQDRRRDLGGLRENLRPAYLQLPDVQDMQTVRSQADEWTKGMKDPKAIAESLESNLKRAYAYSLNVDFSTRPDHLTRFLTVEKAGHCEYFATAMTLMLRAKGIPSRIVNGYATDEWVESSGGYYIVRQEHAHSWVEAYFANVGWMTFDPTPYSGIGANRIPMTWYRWMTRVVDRIKFFWYDNVIDYDVRDQGTILQTVFRVMDQLHLRSAFRVMDNVSVLPQTTGQKRGFFLGMICIGSVMLLYFMSRELRHFLRARASQAEDSTNGRRPSVVIEDYLRLLRELEASYPRSPAQTPLEFAEFVVGAESTLADLLPLTKLYYAARFRENIWAKEETERVNALLRLLRESSKRES